MNNKYISNKLSNIFSPNYEEILVKLTECEYDKALEDLTKLLRNDPKNEIALRYRGEINYLMKKYNESINDLNNLLKIKPNDAWA
ncbi:tetratricopeptide repeat protein [Gigaspora margarita]|uniref:Tetratricopeptide repeat protein n=1 Tax=Gigaspora margarita TaxID=4874 RepID=A0A8H4A7X0_GIGMA|nr:tetratricopeptide repeat protein [Gigaspora margarita]